MLRLSESFTASQEQEQREHIHTPVLSAAEAAIYTHTGPLYLSLRPKSQTLL